MCEQLIKLAVENVAVAALVGNVWSLIVFIAPAFQDLEFGVKRWVVFGLCMIVPVGALLLATVGFACADVTFGADSLAKALMAGSLAFSSSQLVGHLFLRKKA